MLKYFMIIVKVAFILFSFNSNVFSSISPDRIIIDDYAPTPTYRNWYYSRIGTDRGKMGDGNYSVVLGDGKASVTVMSGWAGVWTRLMHTSGDELLSPTKLLGSFVKDEFQPRISGLEIEVLEGRGALKVELKNGSGELVYWKVFNLTGGATKLVFSVSPTSQLKELNWIIDGIGYVTVDEIRFLVDSPTYQTEQAVFLFSYGHLCQCYDKDSGLVRDRARWPVNDYSAVQSIGMFALVSAVAYDLGYIQYTDVIDIITKTKNAILTIPKYKGLMPHFLKNHDIVPDTEWSSIDTVIAFVAEILACQSFGIDTSDLENLLRNIDWDELTDNQSQSVSMGYDFEKVKINNLWDTFGSEAFLVAVAYSAANDLALVKLDNQKNCPTWDGSGFNDEMAALFFPMNGRDVWGNDWIKYRKDAFAKQRSFFSEHSYQNLGLFGLSASEVPEKWLISDERQHYSAWGVGGHNDGANDGTNLVGYPIIAPHYAAMISSENNDAFKTLFNYLMVETKIFTPLNNVESFGVNNLLHWNSLKGSWNLSLQSLGVARALSGANYLPYRSLEENEFLCQAYSSLMLEISLSSAINKLKILTGYSEVEKCKTSNADILKNKKIEMNDILYILHYLSAN